jgi:hypothetical protein
MSEKRYTREDVAELIDEYCEVVLAFSDKNAENLERHRAAAAQLREVCRWRHVDRYGGEDADKHWVSDCCPDQECYVKPKVCPECGRGVVI